MFIPDELARGLSAVTLGGPGGTRPLVSDARRVFAAHRAPPLETPPARARTLFVAGSLVGLLFFLLGWAATRPQLVTAARLPLRALFGLLLAAWGLATGFVGCFLVYVWAFTDHLVAHHNQNILLFAPWALALVVLGIAVALEGPWAGARGPHGRPGGSGRRDRCRAAQGRLHAASGERPFAVVRVAVLAGDLRDAGVLRRQVEVAAGPDPPLRASAPAADVRRTSAWTSDK